MIKGLLTGFLCFILFLILHGIIFHFYGPFEKKFRIIRNIFFYIIPLYFVIYYFLPKDAFMLIPADPILTPHAVLKLLPILNYLIGFMLYAFLFMCYCIFYFLIDRSISVRMLTILEHSPDMKLTIDEFKNIYPPDEIFRRRFRHLVESKCINESGSYYRNTLKGKSMAAFFKFTLHLIRMWPGG